MTATHAERSAWIVGTVGLAGSLAGWIAAPAQFPHAWLAALTFWLGWPLGSLVLVFVHALTGGRWGFAIRAQLGVGIATLPLVLPALLPVIFMRRTLYPWLTPAIGEQLANHFYLNAPFFYARLLVYSVVWITLAFKVRRLLRRNNPERALYRLAPAGLILLALTITFSAIDFTLSLEPHFQSSIYGMLVGCEAVLLALSAAVAGMAAVPRAAQAQSVRDLGKLIFGLLVLWAYLDFMQLLIVWNSDLPDEAGWYVKRLAGEWGAVAALVATLHFLLPFFALIWPQVQRSRRAIGAIAALLVLIEIPRAWWLVVPAGRRDLSWVDAAAMMALVGIAAAIAVRCARQERLSGGFCPHA